MIDPFGRRISYLRLSVTDRCDLRCTYCMPKRAAFLPRSELLGLDELDRLAAAFIRKGVRKLRLTGGEPLVRKGVIGLVERLSRFLANGALDELTLTTNGTRLAHHAADLARLGIRRINVSLDSLDPATFARITRGGRLDEVIAGIDAALAAGIAVKINAVALRDDNLGGLVDLAQWAHRRGAELTVIEVMPVGSVEAERIDQHVPMTEVRRRFEHRWTLTDLARRTGGPARYVRTDAGGTIGFITPLSRNFCDGCNRVRVTCTGRMYMCLGQEARADLAAPLRASADDCLLDSAIDEAIGRKPRGHDFAIRAGSSPAVERHMSATGG
ncbi:GTP 3',8-cyclase MoaA [Allosphingosinicella sp.]|jgi:cyclic pyranopterin phosphate synthase|uniref:GTP 3',8-cyclase MoaA n=1 Tax=Allosphingosinicella sp. TaxID=2823234 RepID=UPI002F10476E